jgi:hypothetical protein
MRLRFLNGDLSRKFFRRRRYDGPIGATSEHPALNLFTGNAALESRWNFSPDRRIILPSPAEALPQASVAERPIALPPEETGAPRASYHL